MLPESFIEDSGISCEVRYSEPMTKYTSLGIGGPAEAMVFPEAVDELAAIVSYSDRCKVPLFCLGGGTNLLVLDGGIPGFTVNMRKLSWMELQRNDEGSSQLHAGAGALLAKLISYCEKAGLSGLEFAAGIPGRLGGAVAMNAGAGESEMRDVLVSVTLVGKDGGISVVPASDIKMEYRRAELPEGSIVAEAALALIPWPAEEVKELVKKNIRRRKATQPMDVRSAGSTFKNPPGYSAWRLIDMAGLRGTKVGAAQVSMRHANFLVNTGGATAKDFLGLMNQVKDTVAEKLNVTLEPEIRVVGVEG